MLDSFNKIYADNYRILHRVVIKMTGDPDVASDVVQEVFIYMYERLKEGHTITYPRSWLNKAVYNKCIDYLRTTKPDQQIKPIIDNIAENNSIETQETSTVIKNALKKLPYKERILAVLYSEGLSYKEMAEATGIKFTSIGKTLSRTLKKLEQEIKNQGYEMP